MHLSPDELVFWHLGFLKLNATIVYTWALMLVLTVGSWLITRRISTGLERSRWQNLLEIIVCGMVEQIREVGLAEPQRYLPFLGTLFLFVGLASICTIIGAPRIAILLIWGISGRSGLLISFAFEDSAMIVSSRCLGSSTSLASAQTMPNT